MNRLTQIWDLASKKTTYTYDRKNRLTSIQHHNGTQQHRDYNAAGQLTELQALDINGHIIASYQFSYDAAGNIVQEAVTPDITQLTDSLPLMDYGFANRLGSVDGQAAEFDGDGNMVKAPNGETLRFDTRNRLVEYGGIEYVFNAENHRVGMRTAEGLTQYVVNPVPALSQTLVKTEPDGSQTYYVYGLGLVSEHGPQGYRTYHYDLRGSTVALSDEQGAVVERFVYSPFGGLVSGDVSATPFLYNGRDGVITDANGLYHMRARFYSPELRRFVNQDVLLGFVAEAQTLNRYAYVTGNPVSFIDPTGLVADYAWDIPVLIYGVYYGFSTGDWTPLAIDTVFAIAPGVPAGTGIAVACGTKGTKNVKGLIGKDFEDYLVFILGGKGNSKAEGREFDGAVGNRWYEAKSGRYWEDHAQIGEKFAKFRSDIGSRKKIAEAHGATYELHSNTPIPQHVKDWLNKKGIPFIEH